MTIKYTSMPLSCVLLVFYGIVFMIQLERLMAKGFCESGKFF